MTKRTIGYYVMTFGGGRYTSIAWYAKKIDAEKELARILTRGAWSGIPPKIAVDRMDGYYREQLRQERTFYPRGR